MRVSVGREGNFLCSVYLCPLKIPTDQCQSWGVVMRKPDQIAQINRKFLSSWSCKRVCPRVTRCSRAWAAYKEIWISRQRLSIQRFIFQIKPNYTMCIPGTCLRTPTVIRSKQSLPLTFYFHGTSHTWLLLSTHIIAPVLSFIISLLDYRTSLLRYLLASNFSSWKYNPSIPPRRNFPLCKSDHIQPPTQKPSTALSFQWILM